MVVRSRLPARGVGRDASRAPRGGTLAGVRADPATTLLPGEWAVLGVLALGPAHGFAVARALAPTGWLGQVWAMGRPRVYRAIADLAASGLIVAIGEEAGERGPPRVIHAVSEQGRRLLDGWLGSPVDHARDVRSELLLKLALLDAAGASPVPLLDAQRDVLAVTLASLEGALEAAAGFDAVILRYRVEAIRGVLAFIAATRDGAGTGS